ncbi:hypothetical protein OH76DRAFT_615120 [Lentinus brumalis]|uniref:BTB domain-containing protein n=1 Tax=Lentinus brumalis TaxID=2498619 RepID=A0A371D8U7_9APHY|nr:hypothetical protein OH76DRAFT_615120 [Polyporus brumalis]
MSARTTKKRARTEDPEQQDAEVPVEEEDIIIVEVDSQAECPVRDEELWFEDGTIVLVAGHVEFKVYVRPLIEHSPVFRDMLSLPQRARRRMQGMYSYMTTLCAPIRFSRGSQVSLRGDDAG